MEILATMPFPTLFPDSKGDPTNTARIRKVTLGEKIKHFQNILMVNEGTGLQAILTLLIGHLI